MSVLKVKDLKIWGSPSTMAPAELAKKKKKKVNCKKIEI